MASIGVPAQGVEKSKPAALITQTDSTKTQDPFAGQREQNGAGKAASPTSPTSPLDRRASSDEWDASKTPPSRFQQRKGSLYATPGSRDGHVDKNHERDAKFHEFHEKKYGGGKRRPSSSKGSDV